MNLFEELKLIKFDDSIRTNLIDNYLNFNDRSSRSDYIWWTLFSTILNFTLNQFDIQSAIIISIILFLPGLGVSIRRLHDINKTGWNLLWSFTIIGILPLYYWMLVKPGDKDENFYGKNPLKEFIKV